MHVLIRNIIQQIFACACVRMIADFFAWCLFEPLALDVIAIALLDYSNATLSKDDDKNH